MIRGIKYLTNAQRRHGFRRHGSGALNGPCVIVLQQQGADAVAMAAALAKFPTTSVRRLISPFRCPLLGV